MATAFFSKGLVLVLGVGLCTPALTGCARTDDGTILLTERSAPPRLTERMDPALYSRASRERLDRAAQAGAFPHPPRGASYRWRDDRPPPPRFAPVRVGVTPPFKPGQEADGLTCRNETTPEGRVRVNCD